LNVGDIIAVRGVNASEIKVGKVSENPEGDIIVFYDPTGRTRPVYWFFKARALIVHRAIDKKFDNATSMWYFRTQGDHNSDWDRYWPDNGGGKGWVPDSYVVGKVVGRMPWLGRVSLFMQSDVGMTVIVMLIIFMIVIDYVILPTWESLKSEKRRA
ncbi:MAG: hypothetical protein ACE5K2_08095, partial [Candidatus Zixiibacteriota bacterium]